MKIFKKIFFSLSIISLFLSPILVSADTADQKAAAKLIQMKAEAAKLNQLPTTNAQQIIGLAVKALMMFMGAIMFLLVVYGGVLWMTASGNSEKIDKAKNIIIWAALGVAVMLVSYMAVNFVFSKLATG